MVGASDYNCVICTTEPVGRVMFVHRLQADGGFVTERTALVPCEGGHESLVGTDASEILYRFDCNISFIQMHSCLACEYEQFPERVPALEVLARVLFRKAYGLLLSTVAVAFCIMTVPI